MSHVYAQAKALTRNISARIHRVPLDDFSHGGESKTR